MNITIDNQKAGRWAEYTGYVAAAVTGLALTLGGVPWSPGADTVTLVAEPAAPAASSEASSPDPLGGLTGGTNLNQAMARQSAPADKAQAEVMRGYQTTPGRRSRSVCAQLKSDYGQFPPEQYPLTAAVGEELSATHGCLRWYGDTEEVKAAAVAEWKTKTDAAKKKADAAAAEKAQVDEYTGSGGYQPPTEPAPAPTQSEAEKQKAFREQLTVDSCKATAKVVADPKLAAVFAADNADTWVRSGCEKLLPGQGPSAKAQAAARARAKEPRREPGTGPHDAPSIPGSSRW